MWVFENRWALEDIILCVASAYVCITYRYVWKHLLLFIRLCCCGQPTVEERSQDACVGIEATSKWQTNDNNCSLNSHLDEEWWVRLWMLLNAHGSGCYCAKSAINPICVLVYAPIESTSVLWNIHYLPLAVACAKEEKLADTMPIRRRLMNVDDWQ